MVQISKYEADIIRKRFPALHMKRTVHKYYVEESPAVLRFLGKAPAKRRKDGASV